MKFFALIIFISLFPYLNCTSSENGKNKETKQSKSIKLKKYSPKDLPFIGCSVCEKVSKELYSQVTKLTYFDKQVERTIDNICKEYDVDHYTWIHKYDIREKKIQVNGKEKRQLYLEEPGGISKECGSECFTIQKSCQNLFEKEVDVTDLVNSIVDQDKISMTIDSFTSKLCKDMSSRCNKDKYLDDIYYRQEEAFHAMTDQELEDELEIVTDKLIAKAGTDGVQVVFEATKESTGAQLFGGPSNTMFIGHLRHDSPIKLVSYLGHEFAMKKDGVLLKKISITYHPFQWYMYSFREYDNNKEL